MHISKKIGRGEMWDGSALPPTPRLPAGLLGGGCVAPRGTLDNGNSCTHSSGDQKSELKAWAGAVPSEPARGVSRSIGWNALVAEPGTGTCSPPAPACLGLRERHPGH